jgi:Zn-finger nucleic acid-binding protein
MKCHCCGREHPNADSDCCFCGERPAFDLPSIHFRNLGVNEMLPCPDCGIALSVVEVGLTPPTNLERCSICAGLFFNPGELEYVLESQSKPVVWMDGRELQHLAVSYIEDRTVRCPMCREPMSRVVFGGRSEVIVDQCQRHGVWMKAGDLRRIAEWWCAGGTHEFQDHQGEGFRNRARAVTVAPSPGRKKGEVPTGPIDPWHGDLFEIVGWMGAGIGRLFD